MLSTGLDVVIILGNKLDKYPFPHSLMQLTVEGTILKVRWVCPIYITEEPYLTIGGRMKRV